LIWFFLDKDFSPLVFCRVCPPRSFFFVSPLWGGYASPTRAVRAPILVPTLATGGLSLARVCAPGPNCFPLLKCPDFLVCWPCPKAGLITPLVLETKNPTPNPTQTPTPPVLFGGAVGPPATLLCPQKTWGGLSSPRPGSSNKFFPFVFPLPPPLSFGSFPLVCFPALLKAIPLFHSVTFCSPFFFFPFPKIFGCSRIQASDLFVPCCRHATAAPVCSVYFFFFLIFRLEGPPPNCPPPLHFLPGGQCIPLPSLSPPCSQDVQRRLVCPCWSLFPMGSFFPGALFSMVQGLEYCKPTAPPPGPEVTRAVRLSLWSTPLSPRLHQNPPCHWSAPLCFFEPSFFFNQPSLPYRDSPFREKGKALLLTQLLCVFISIAFCSALLCSFRHDPDFSLCPFCPTLCEFFLAASERSC